MMIFHAHESQVRMPMLSGRGREEGKGKKKSREKKESSSSRSGLVAKTRGKREKEK